MDDTKGTRADARSAPHALDCMHPAAEQRLGPGIDLRDAIERNALSVAYQPQFELRTGSGRGVEALARWVLATGESVAPSTFIPLAERTGLIHQFGAWVLRSACGTAQALFSRDMPRTMLSVNVSGLQINEGFCAVIEQCLRQTGFPARQLELEITETAFLADTILTIEHLKQWKALGIQIAVDDFGTGYSSLSYLSRLPIDRLKLDQSLIHRMGVDKRSTIVMRSIISLGAELGLDVIAEGVETELQFQMLTDMGCPQGQGYLLGRPMPAKLAQLAMRKPWGNRLASMFEPLRSVIGDCSVH